MHELRQDINYDSVGKPKRFVDVFEFRALVLAGIKFITSCFLMDF